MAAENRFRSLPAWNDGKVRVFAPESGRLILIIHDAHNMGVTAIAGTRNCKRIISGGGKGMVSEMGPNENTFIRWGETGVKTARLAIGPFPLRCFTTVDFKFSCLPARMTTSEFCARFRFASGNCSRKVIGCWRP